VPSNPESRDLEDELVTLAAPATDTPASDGASNKPLPTSSAHEKPGLMRLFALLFMHAGCLGAFWVGVSPAALVLAAILYVTRAFGLTAFYHRYFSHRAFKTSRWFQLLGALLGCTAMQKGPLWWAAHHRDHHRFADSDGDVHSPHVHGFSWAHMGWFLTPGNNKPRYGLVRDWLRFPELRWVDRCSPLIASLLAVTLFGVGETLRLVLPGLGTSGLQLIVWCFFISTVFLYHVTYSVNSFAHLMGTRRFPTADGSRNNLVVALLALGEGWHNNHHHYPSSARQGFYPWEVDLTYYMLVALARVGLIWDLRPVPDHVLSEGLQQPRS
jgi:stearoyl-CoA desaturase (delta-9 desaturase)